MVDEPYKQPFIGIWFHDNNFLPDLQNKMKLCLNRTFYYYRIFASHKEFYTYIAKEQLVVRIFLIISTIDTSLKCLLELTEKYPQIFEKVYIFSSATIQMTNRFMTNNTDVLFKQINKDMQNSIGSVISNRDVREMSFAEDDPSTTSSNYRWLPSLCVFNSTSQTNIPIQHLTKESLRFLCFLRMIDILRRSRYDRNELSAMWSSVRDHYKGNQEQLDAIDELEETYDKAKAIHYYTGNSCLSRVVNQTFHTENMREIFTYRVYISDLHQQLVNTHNQDEQNGLKECIVKVYRGKPLSGSALQQLIDNVGGLVSMNGFLSTTVDSEVASHYHGDEQVTKCRPGYRPVLFEFKIDASMKQPYAYIGDCSTKPDEAEVLFSLGTLWRIKDVKISNELCTIVLSAYDESDLQLLEVLKELTGKECDMLSIGDLFFRLGEYDEAEWFYEKMLKQSSLNDEIKRTLHYKIGMIRFERKDYFVALKRFEDALRLFPSKTDKPNQISAGQLGCVYGNQSPFITIHTNMGIIHQAEEQYEKAEGCYKQAVEIKSESQLGRATAHNRLGLLYFCRKKYKEAREHHKKAVDLIDKSDSNWIEFERNLEFANQRCEHVMSKRKNNKDIPTQYKSLDDLETYLLIFFIVTTILSVYIAALL